jgi:hypothetical protein
MLNKNYPAGQSWILLEASLSDGDQGVPEARLAISDLSERKQAEAVEIEREAAKR